MKRSLKSVLGHFIFTSHLYQILLRRAAVVVAFHRVSDASNGDPLTVGADMFERHCRFFMRHFQVVPLRDLVSRLEHGLPLRRHMAITFDDGYRDNYENAAPVLERLNLPATFFVVSQWIGSEVVPWWDQQRGVRHSWMTWDQVRSLQRRGFDIGAHTRTHVDLGQVGEREAQGEILGAQAELNEKLGVTIDLFAYPYGNRHNLVDANRDLVKAAGFRCCCSCFGGVVNTGTDPFHLPRLAISPWYASPHEVGLELALGTSLLHS